MFSGLQQVKRTLSRSECFSVLLGRARGIVGRVGVEKKTRVGMWGLGNNADMLINMLLARFHVLASFTGGGEFEEHRPIANCHVYTNQFGVLEC